MSIDPSQVRVLGPLSPFAAGFAEELAQQGYRPRAVRNQMGLVAHLSRWLLGEDIGAEKLHATEVERFVGARRAAGYKRLVSIKALQPMLVYLRDLAWPQHRRRPRPAVRWKWRWSDTEAT